MLGALIIQSVNSLILLSGMPVEFNLVIKALIIIAILVIQSPTVKHYIYLLRASALPIGHESPAAKGHDGTVAKEGRS